MLLTEVLLATRDNEWSFVIILCDLGEHMTEYNFTLTMPGSHDPY